MCELEHEVQYVTHADSRLYPGGVFFFTGCFELGRGLAGRKASTGRQLGARASRMHSSSELDTGMAACNASTAVYCGLYASCVGTWQDATLLRGASQVQEQVGRTSALRWVGAWQDAMPLLRSTGVGRMQKSARRTPKGVLRDS